MMRAMFLILCLFAIGCSNGDRPGLPEEKKVVTESTITCPNCGHRKKEIMPVDACVGKYTCEKCDTLLIAKDGDCCVYCSYGDTICPPEQ